MTYIKFLFTTLIISTLFQVNIFAQLSPAAIQKLDAYIEQARQQWEAPGLAVAVMKDGKLIFAKGYGVRELGKPEKVDGQTIFAICSTTKAMTAAAMGILVDEGKVKWDDKVVQHLPDFQLYDPYVTRELRVRDLFTHNAGLGNADFLWDDTDLTSDDILHRMRLLPMSYPFRGGYTYQNIMYLAAGKMIEKVSGMSWEDFVEKRLFQPIGMTNTYANQKRSLVQKNRSIPHDRIQGKITPITDSNADPIAPAGSVWSSIEDMAKWTQFVLDSAKVNGKSLLKPATYAEWLKPQTIVSDAGFYPSQELTKPHWKTYALGWFQHDYNGRAVSFHTGSLSGTIAICGMIPDEKIGVYVFGNLDHAEVRHAIMYKVFDVLGGQENGRDWSTDLKKIYDRIAQQSEEARKKQEAQRVLGTKPTLALEKYTGTYSSPLYGDVKVELQNGKLVGHTSSKNFITLEHWHYDTCQGSWKKTWDGKS
ncbi:MAG: serine hydrolase, partial [Saprospiraceae bacterium]